MADGHKMAVITIISNTPVTEANAPTVVYCHTSLTDKEHASQAINLAQIEDSVAADANGYHY